MQTKQVGLLLAAISLAACGADYQPGTVVQEISPNASGRPTEGYANRRSVGPGEAISFFLHSPTNEQVRFEIVRFSGVAAGNTGALNEVPLPISNGETSVMLAVGPRQYPAWASVAGANWDASPSFTFSIPTRSPLVSYGNYGWKSGYFAARVSNPSTGQVLSYVPFVVKASTADRAGRAMLVAATNTWAAYNFWPYDHSFSTLSFYPECPNVAESDTVSYLRPNPNASPFVVDVAGNCTTSPERPIDSGQRYREEYNRTDHLFLADARLAAWFERVRLLYAEYPGVVDYTVVTDEDLDDCASLDPASVPMVVLGGHNEYWTQAMYDNVEAYLNGGGNLINLSGNTMYHRVTRDETNGRITKLTTANTPNPYSPAWAPCSAAATNWCFSRAAQSRLLGVVDSGIGGASSCVPYSTTDPTVQQHALTAGLSTSLGATSVLNSVNSRIVPWWDPNANNSLTVSHRTFCGRSTDDNSTGTTAAAAGWESDAILKNDAGENRPGFFREFSNLAHAAFSTGQSNIVHARRLMGGRVFSAGSILFTASLLGDVVNVSSTQRTLTPMLARVINQFARASYTDFTGNRVPDLVAFNGSSVVRYEINRAGAGSIVPGSSSVTVPIPSSDARVLPVGDFNGDGTSDLLIGSTSTGGWKFFNDPAHVAYGSGTGTPITFNPTGFDLLFPAGDFDGDGRTDVIGRSAGSLFLFRGNGTGGFINPSGTLFDSGWAAWTSLSAVGDLNGDGNQDLIGVRPNPNVANSVQVVFVRGRGDGTLFGIDNSSIKATLDYSQANRQYMGIGLFGTVPGTEQEPGAEPWPERPELLYRLNGALFRCLASSVDNTLGDPEINVDRCLQVDSGWTFSQLYTVW